jgi:hypothetical protein
MRTCVTSTDSPRRLEICRKTLAKTLDACWRRCYFTDRSVGYPQIKIIHSTPRAIGQGPLSIRNCSAELWGRAEFQLSFARQTNS